MTIKNGFFTNKFILKTKPMIDTHCKSILNKKKLLKVIKILTPIETKKPFRIFLCEFLYQNERDSPFLSQSEYQYNQQNELHCIMFVHLSKN